MKTKPFARLLALIALPQMLVIGMLLHHLSAGAGTKPNAVNESDDMGIPEVAFDLKSCDSAGAEDLHVQESDANPPNEAWYDIFLDVVATQLTADMGTDPHVDNPDAGVEDIDGGLADGETD